jgi:UDP-glucose 4-epimerase
MPGFTVLGSTGFIGSRLTQFLMGRGHEVLAPPRGDSLLDRPLGHVIYCVGLTTDHLERPLDTAEAHACALLPLLRTGRFERFVYLSSIRVYDGAGGLARETDLLHLDPLVPRRLYDLSKALGEALVHQAGRPGVVVRLGSAYDDTLGENDFLCRTVRGALAADLITVDADPEGGRDYIHIDDVCSALEAIALDPRERVYNVASGAILANRDLAVACERELGCRVIFRRPDVSLPVPAVDIARLERDFGLRPQQASQRLPMIMRGLKGAIP